MTDHYHMTDTVALTTERLVVRQIGQEDAFRLADYYAANRQFLKPWEPTRDESYYQPAGWIMRLNMIEEMHRQRVASCFLILQKKPSDETLGVINFSQICHGCLQACTLGYSLAKHWQGRGIMYEALRAAIPHMQRAHTLHRIMASYMPHNQRSGNLLSRLGFEQEGYAKAYLLINGQWQDHILTSLITPHHLAE